MGLFKRVKPVMMVMITTGIFAQISVKSPVVVMVRSKMA